MPAAEVYPAFERRMMAACEVPGKPHLLRAVAAMHPANVGTVPGQRRNGGKLGRTGARKPIT